MTNWNRWGHQDERGTLNLITAARLLAALRLPNSGHVYILAETIRTEGVPMFADGGRPVHVLSRDGGDYAAGFESDMGRCHADGYLFIRCHGNTTHLDALGHVWYEGQLYNGFSSDTVLSTGMQHCGVDKIGAIVTRGLMLDVAAARGVDRLAGGDIVSVKDIEKCADVQGVDVRPGDAVLLHTGWRTKFDEDVQAYLETRPGLGIEGARWLADRDVVLVGADTIAVECLPYDSATTMSPVHQLLLRDYGIYMLELLRLEELARDQVYEFLFIAVPLRIAGGSGSPLTPVAIA